MNLGSSISVSATSNTPVTHTNFLRYVRWLCDGSVASAPVALIDLVAKD